MENKKAYLWALIGNFAPHAISLLSNMILARVLLPEEYGKIAVLTIFVAIANVLLDSGLGGSLIKEKSVTPLDYSTISVFNITVSTFIYIGIFFMAGHIEDFYKIEGLSKIARWLCLCFVINSWGLVPKAILIRSVDFKTISKINIISYLVASIISIIIGIKYRNAYALIANQLINNLLHVILTVYKSKYVFSFKFSIESFKRLIPFGIFTTITSVIDSIYENLISVIIGKVFSAQQAGYVSQAKRLEELSARSVANTVNNVAFPILVKYKNDRELFYKEANKIFRTILLFSTPILLSVALFSEHIVYFLWGEQWIDSAKYLQLLMFAGIFILVESLNRNFIKSLTIVDKLLKITIIKRVLGIAIIILSSVFCPDYLLHFYILSSFIGFLFNNYIYSNHMKISFWNQVKDLCVIMFPNTIYYIIVSVISQATSNVLLPLFVAVLLLILYFFLILPLFGISTKKIIKEHIIKNHN